MALIDNSTLHLLNSASLVGFSGGLRLYLAYLLAGIQPNLLLVLAASLIIYATYTLDRSLDNKEDEVNHEELAGSRKAIGLTASGITIIAGTMLFFSKNLFFPPLFPFIVGVLYSRGIPLGQRSIKLKGGCGIKNAVIGVTWGGTIGLVIAFSGQIIPGIAISLYFGLKLFINSTIFDMKDVKGDLAAGIQTLPLVLGEQRVRVLLFSLYLIQHLIFLVTLFLGMIVFYKIVFLYSLVSTGIVITCYSSAFEESNLWLKRKFRNFLIDGESTISVLLSTALPC